MEFKNIADMHTHSIISFDGNDSCEALCDSAAHCKAVALAITDHCDIDGKEDFDELVKTQFEKTLTVKNEYDAKLEVLQGLEIGQGIYRKNQVDKYLDEYSYDFILGSLHNLENMEDFYFLHYKDYDIYELMGRYFDGILELCEWGRFDSLAHLTYPLRYIVGRDKIEIDLKRFDSVCDAIFESLIKNNKALEINTSGLYMEIGETLPSEKYIRRFKELGGKYITVGSDSHYAKYICRGIKDGYELALKCGFEQVTLFRKREPVLINIV